MTVRSIISRTLIIVGLTIASTSAIVYSYNGVIKSVSPAQAQEKTDSVEPLWELPNGTKIYRNVDWLNNNVCYTTVSNFTSDMAISCVSMVK